MLNNNETKLASVLIIIFAESPKILMIKKPITMNHHGGEIAFPGGKISDEDNDLLDTALRETKEETGITVEREKIIGQLEPVTTLNSGFTILPFVCILDKIENLPWVLSLSPIIRGPTSCFKSTDLIEELTLAFNI